MSNGLRFVLPFQTPISPSSTVYPGCQLFFYLTGTDTAAPTYSDAALTAENPQPVVADAGGTFGNIFIDTSITYKVVLEDENGVQIWTADPLDTAPLPDMNINDLTGVLENSKGGTGVGDGSLEGIVLANGNSPFSSIPPPAGSIVGTTATQTLTNKTLTSPQINGGDLAGVDYASTKLDFAGVARALGTLGIVRRAVATAQQLVQTDNGTCIESTATGNVLTVPQNSTTPLSSDFAVEFYNRTGGNVTIVQGTGVTLRLMGGGALTGNRVLAAWSKCTIEATATLNEFTIAGAGVS